MNILITGCAGFIGFHLSQHLLNQGHHIVGIDNLNDYYDPELKKNRLKVLKTSGAFKFFQLDICDSQKLFRVFNQSSIEVTIHLAAQAGVRYSLTHPEAYIQNNLMGFCNILEAVRGHGVKHLIYASSSSVYGANQKMPFSVNDGVNHPLSLYAATKRANELMAHCYSSLYSIPTTGLRFFTVYGPWGRPDMALFLFTKAIMANQPIEIFNHGRHLRDFTYIDDIVQPISLMIDKPAMPDPNWSAMNPNPASSFAPFRIYNIGRNNPTQLMHYIECLEKSLGKKATKLYKDKQPGDVAETYADVSELVNDFNYQPKISVEEGIRSFVSWYLDYYH